MTPTQLREFIAQALPAWQVTINEQYMLNVQADQMEEADGFVYVEEMNTASVSFSKWQRQRTHQHDVYFCVLGEFDTTAEQREAIREQRIMPAVNKVEEALRAQHNVTEYQEDKNPRGFDAHEILVHIRFKTEDRIC